jgi:fatty-acid desaturase
VAALFFFTWKALFVALFVYWVAGSLGIGMGYHRLLTHRGFSCPRWLERTLAVFGACCLQESPIVWGAQHRQHHHLTDQAGDPHSPLVGGFLWGHIGWLFLKTEATEAGPSTFRYAKDLAADPFCAWLEVHDNWIKVGLMSWAVFFAIGFGAGVVTGASLTAAVAFGLSLVVWSAVVRTVLAWHFTWLVNSAAHLWGYRNYETPDNSRNNFVVALLSTGEGWHNNHHADPRSARHGHRKGELDLAWLAIRALAALGLVWDIAVPSPNLEARLKARALRLERAGEDPT